MSKLFSARSLFDIILKKAYNVGMSIYFKWDESKALANKKKHGVSFEEARTVFFDEHARVITDTDNSDTEERFIILGVSAKTRLLIVSHCYREDDHVIRIISSRKASIREAKLYREFKR